MMNITLLAAQAALADTLAGGNPVLTPVSEEARMNLWDMAMKGGWIMLVLALLSVVCFYIFFERMAVIRKAGKDDPLFMERIRDYIRTGEIKSAINYCRITKPFLANTLSNLLLRKVLMVPSSKSLMVASLTPASSGEKLPQSVIISASSALSNTLRLSAPFFTHTIPRLSW